jgi:putative ABC transport system substrate-binding protein
LTVFDVILAATPSAIEATTRATRTIPIVGVDLESDPVAKGWAATLAHPGGNFTGFVLDILEMSGKQLQFLKEVKPDLSRVAVLGDPRVNELQSRATEAAARGAGLTIQALRQRCRRGPEGARRGGAQAPDPRDLPRQTLPTPVGSSPMDPTCPISIERRNAVCRFAEMAEEQHT